MTRESLGGMEPLFEAVPDGILIADQQGMILRVNQRIEQLFGYRRDELVGQPVELLMPERLRTAHVAQRDVYSKHPDVREMGERSTLLARRKDGSEFPVEISLGPLQDGEHQLITAIIRDQSEHKRLEQAFSELLDSAPDATVISDGSGTIVRMNRAAEATFGYSRDELIGQSIEVLVPERFRGGHARHRHEYYQQPSVRFMGEGRELFALRKDGSEFPAEISLGTMQQQNGGLLVTSAVRDITERKQLQQALQERATALERSNAELEQFAYVASHDLQEPLRIIGSFSQLLQRRYQGKLGEEADEFIHFIVDGAKRMQDLINDLLGYSRVSTRGKPFEPNNVNQIAAQAIQNLQLAIEDSQAQVEVEPLPSLLADGSQLTQLFQNLLSNAIKFCTDGAPRIHISASERAVDFLFTVEDNGIGIEPQFAQRIFNIFQRLHGKGEFPGTGIGLAVCKKIVERHGGRIWVEPAQPHGSIFCFTLAKQPHQPEEP